MKKGWKLGAIGTLVLPLILATSLIPDHAAGTTGPDLRKRLRSFAARYNGQVFESKHGCALSLTFQGDRLTLRNVLPSSMSSCTQETSVCDGAPAAFICDQIGADSRRVEYVYCHAGENSIIGVYEDGRVSGYSVSGGYIHDKRYFYPTGRHQYQYCPLYEE